MVDVTASSSAVPPAGNRVSSRQYLEELRARRLSKTTPAAPTPPQPVTLTPPPTETAPPAPPVAQTAPAASFEPSEQFSPPQAAPNPEPSEYPQDNVPTNDVFPGQQRPRAEETVYEWTAASRPFKKRNRQFYTTIGLITALISMILFFAGQFLPIAVVIAVAFLGYVLSSVPPDSISNKLTTYGIRTDTVLYYWDELGNYWFEEKYGSPLLHVEVARFPGRITLLLNETQKKAVTTLLSEVLLELKPKDTFIDKSAQWLQEKIPLDVS